jgi:hypothetical protein
MAGFAPKLQYFDMSYCLANLESFNAFFRSPELNLETVILRESSWLTNDSLVTLSRLPHLKTVVMDGCPLITDYGVKTLISARRKTLVNVTIKNCRLISDALLRTILQRFPKSSLRS